MHYRFLTPWNGDARFDAGCVVDEATLLTVEAVDIADLIEVGVCEVGELDEAGNFQAHVRMLGQADDKVIGLVDKVGAAVDAIEPGNVPDAEPLIHGEEFKTDAAVPELGPVPPGTPAELGISDAPKARKSK